MKRIKLSKAGMLTNRPEFHKDCNELRKLINRVEKTDDHVWKDEHIEDVSIQFQVMMPKYRVGFCTICEVIRISPKRVKKMIEPYPLFADKKVSEVSYLEDRQHHARNIIDGLKTRKEVAEATGYHYQTVVNWVNDYKVFGNKMTNQAIAFRRIK